MGDYVRLGQSESYADDEKATPSPPSTTRSNNTQSYLLVTVITALFASIAFNVLLLHGVATPRNQTPPKGRYAQNKKLEPLDTVWKRFYWHTRWDSKNRTESDLLWAKINPAHGFITAPRPSAAQNGWPESMYLPDDHSQGVYLLEAYHQLHCLKILRLTFHEAVEGKPYTYGPHHAEHCFDALRQSVVCNADSTPLYTFGDKTAGDGQMHQCRSWEQLSTYASENSACYQDSVEDIPLGQHFGHCDTAMEDGIDPNEGQVV